MIVKTLIRMVIINRIFNNKTVHKWYLDSPTVLKFFNKYKNI